ncbi:MerR family transcriptional regulator [Aestuariispira insulae]|uniref:B12 binding protein n=1 Tax=Aestuariispira insulae TaxID=1461337 RepID=A0A3D9HS66_9PROT|nr:MerR family transcriptional regulator [Aestuariispira insulae]RED52310.1 B12 binding protein [Aestuariispira insulae]
MSDVKLNTSAVCSIAEIKPETLRTWERRYQAVAPQRDESGRRQYSETDVNRISMLVRLVQDGHAIGQVAQLEDEDLARLADKAVKTVRSAESSFVRGIIEAIDEINIVEMHRRISAVLHSHPPLTAYSNFIIPLLQRIGDRWEKGELSVAQEHILSNAIRQQLSAMPAQFSTIFGKQPVLISTPVGELHELGSLMAGHIAAYCGYPIIQLGPNTPIEDLAMLARQTDAAAVALSLVAREHLRQAEIQVRNLECLLPETVELWIGGCAAQELAGTGRLRIFRDLVTFEQFLKDLDATRS